MEVIFSYSYSDYDYGYIDNGYTTNLNLKSKTGISGKVLVLNQSYEPITLCSPQKAIILLLLTKAEMVAEKKNRKIRTVNMSYPFPSVIKLLNYIKISFKNVELSRKNVIRRDGNRCQYCNKKSIGMTIDHIIPKSRGGNDTWENLITACVRCNNRKGNRTPEEAGMPLLSNPRKPNHINFLKQHLGIIDDTWKPFLFMD